MNTSVKLTVFFEAPFWVGIFEKNEENSLSICRVVFGEEPKDYEVYEFVLKEYNNLKFSIPIAAYESEINKINPKRLQRKIKKETQDLGIGTKAQLAMKQQQEANKTNRAANLKEEREKEKERLFELKQQKKKEKHRGH